MATDKHPIMIRRIPLFLFFTASLSTIIACSAESPQAPTPRPAVQGQRGPNVPDFWVRPGFKVTLVAELRNARFMEFDDKGNLYVSQPDLGTISTFKPEGQGY